MASRRRGSQGQTSAALALIVVPRNFTAPDPNHLWVADITYIPTWAGFLYLALVLDAWSQWIVGWAMATHLRTELVLDALNLGFAQRRPAEVVHHFDCQAITVSGVTAMNTSRQREQRRASAIQKVDPLREAVCDDRRAGVEARAPDGEVRAAPPPGQRDGKS